MEYTLNNGQQINLTLKYSLLYALKTGKPREYKEYCGDVLSMEDAANADFVFGPLRIIYTGYLCGLIAERRMNEAVSFGEFVSLVPEDIRTNAEMAGALINPKKQTASAAPSGDAEAEAGTT